MLNLTKEEVELITNLRKQKANEYPNGIIVVLDILANYITYIKANGYIDIESYVTSEFSKSFSDNREFMNNVEDLLEYVKKYKFETLPEISINTPNDAGKSTYPAQVKMFDPHSAKQTLLSAIQQYGK